MEHEPWKNRASWYPWCLKQSKTVCEGWDVEARRMDPLILWGKECHQEPLLFHCMRGMEMNRDFCEFSRHLGLPQLSSLKSSVANPPSSWEGIQSIWEMQENQSMCTGAFGLQGALQSGLPSKTALIFTRTLKNRMLPSLFSWC